MIPLDVRPLLARLSDNAAATSGALFVSNGLLSRWVYRIADHESNFYCLGGMGLASSVAFGYAETGRRAWVIEGDGNFLMSMPLASYCGQAIPLTHIVICNGIYESTGGQQLPGSSLLHNWPTRPHMHVIESGSSLDGVLAARDTYDLFFVSARHLGDAERIPLSQDEIAERFRRWRESSPPDRT